MSRITKQSNAALNAYSCGNKGVETGQREDFPCLRTGVKKANISVESNCATCWGELRSHLPHNVSQYMRHVVVAFVFEQAAAECNRPDGEDVASPG